MKLFQPGVMEIKRMYTLPEFRGNGAATEILAELEKWAVEIRIDRTILETGKEMRSAVELYRKNGYIVIPNYGQYKDVASSICSKKDLINYHRNLLCV
jgi:GNAT superfamily N-acetyltransferase